MLLLDTPSTLADTNSPLVASFIQTTTLQSLLRIKDHHVEAANAFMHESDVVVNQVTSFTKSIMKSFAEKQVLQHLNQICTHECVSPFTSLEHMDSLLPGSASLIYSAIVRHVENSNIEKIYSLHIFNKSLNRKLLDSIVYSISRLMNYNDELFGNDIAPSKHALSYVSGLCAGNDTSFNHGYLAMQLQVSYVGKEEDASLYDTLTKRSCLAMHVFDNLSSENVNVRTQPKFTHMTYEEYTSLYPILTNASFLLEVELTAFSNSFFFPMVFNVRDRADILASKIEAAENIIQTCGYTLPLFKPIPKLRILTTKYTASAASSSSSSSSSLSSKNASEQDELETLALWLANTISLLLVHPETRAIGLDIGTGNNTELFKLHVAQFWTEDVDREFSKRAGERA
jgi:hypothetical protein